jgi:uncharacterized membrane protein
MKTAKIIWKKEIGFLVLSFVVLSIFLKIFYYYDSPMTILKVCAGVFYLFILPGYSFLLGFRDEMNCIARFVLAFILGIALEGLTVYYLNLIFHIPVMPYYKIYPLIFIAAGLVFYQRFNLDSRKRTKIEKD